MQVGEHQALTVHLDLERMAHSPLAAAGGSQSARERPVQDGAAAAAELEVD